MSESVGELTPLSGSAVGVEKVEQTAGGAVGSKCYGCGGSVSSYPNGCPQCGAPMCCETCCRADAAMAGRVADVAEAYAWKVLAKKRQTLISALDTQVRQQQTHIEVLQDEVRRLTGGLAAISGSPPYITRDAMKSVAYDVVFNLIERDVAEFQLFKRAEKEETAP